MKEQLAAPPAADLVGSEAGRMSHCTIFAQDVMELAGRYEFA
jgi:hypothetical protein